MHSYKGSAVVVDTAESIGVHKNNTLGFFGGVASIPGLVSSVENLFVVNKGKYKRHVVFLGFFNELFCCLEVVSD